MDRGNEKFPGSHKTRQLARLGGSYFIDCVRIVSEAFDRDLAVGVTFFAIFRANSQTRAAAWKGASASPASGRERRPISGRALAETLDLPYETVRRHVRKLRNAGLCKTGPEGAVTPAGFQDSDFFKRLSDQIWRLTHEFLQGPAGALAPTSPPIPAHRFSVRLELARIANEYFLDSLAAVRGRLGLGLVEVIVLTAIGSANVRAVSSDPDLARTYGDLDSVMGDDERRPVSAYAVAKQLSLPYETVRRTALRLVELGLAERGPEGAFIIPARAMASEPLIAAVADSATLTDGFLVKLVEIGVLPAAH
jgi:DNA-binding transcriptional ArsR family regulator